MLKANDVESGVEAVVLEQLTTLLEEVSEGPVPAVAPASSLRDLALDSLVLARLIIELEEALGVEPFADEEASVGDVRTVADLVRICAEAVRRQEVPA